MTQEYVITLTKTEAWAVLKTLTRHGEGGAAFAAKTKVYTVLAAEARELAKRKQQALDALNRFAAEAS